jgi:hypothetical protein
MQQGSTLEQQVFPKVLSRTLSNTASIVPVLMSMKSSDPVVGHDQDCGLMEPTHKRVASSPPHSPGPLPKISRQHCHLAHITPKPLPVTAALRSLGTTSPEPSKLQQVLPTTPEPSQLQQALPNIAHKVRNHGLPFILPLKYIEDNFDNFSKLVPDQDKISGHSIVKMGSMTTQPDTYMETVADTLDNASLAMASAGHHDFADGHHASTGWLKPICSSNYDSQLKSVGIIDNHHSSQAVDHDTNAPPLQHIQYGCQLYPSTSSDPDMPPSQANDFSPELIQHGCQLHPSAPSRLATPHSNGNDFGSATPLHASEDTGLSPTYMETHWGLRKVSIPCVECAELCIMANSAVALIALGKKHLRTLHHRAKSARCEDSPYFQRKIVAATTNALATSRELIKDAVATKSIAFARADSCTCHGQSTMLSNPEYSLHGSRLQGCDTRPYDTSFFGTMEEYLILLQEVPMWHDRHARDAGGHCRGPT